MLIILNTLYKIVYGAYYFDNDRFRGNNRRASCDDILPYKIQIFSGY